MYSAPSVYRPPFYRQPRLLPKFSSVPISPIFYSGLKVITRKVNTGNYSNQNNSPVPTLNYEINDCVGLLPPVLSPTSAITNILVCPDFPL
jgi:hypothetical protein